MVQCRVHEGEEIRGSQQIIFDSDNLPISLAELSDAIYNRRGQSEVAAALENRDRPEAVDRLDELSNLFDCDRRIFVFRRVRKNVQIGFAGQRVVSKTLNRASGVLRTVVNEEGYGCQPDRVAVATCWMWRSVSCVGFRFDGIQAES
jgi:hypothetical protein